MGLLRAVGHRISRRLKADSTGPVSASWLSLSVLGRTCSKKPTDGGRRGERGVFKNALGGRNMDLATWLRMKDFPANCGSEFPGISERGFCLACFMSMGA